MSNAAADRKPVPEPNIRSSFLSRFKMLFIIQIIIFLSVLVSSPAAHASDVYVSQSGGGSGSSCSSARSVSSLSSGDWAGGTTIHLCGAITTALNALGSGSSGNPINVRFESGAKISLPFCPATGCLQIDGQSYIVVDGGVPCGPSVKNKSACNGIIEANANGTNFANHDSHGTGVRMNNVTNIEVRNLIVQNLYVHTSPSDYSPSAPWPSCMDLPGTASQVKIHDNTMHDALWCANTISSSPTDHIYWYNNETYNTGHAYAVGVTTQTDDSIYIHDNYDHDHANWDTAGCAYHDDGIHAFQTAGGLITNLYEYNNIFAGNWGSCPTAMVYTEGTAFTLWAFNNIGLGQNSVAIPNGCFTLTVGPSGSAHAYNNTCVMSATQNNYNIKWEGQADIQNNATANTTQYIATMSSVTVPSGKLIDYNAWGVSATYCQWYASNSATTQCNGAPGYLNFSQWQTYLRNTLPSSSGDAHGFAVATPANLGLDSTGRPQSGSPVIGKGHNLSSICSGQPNPGIGALCYDADGKPRPSGTTSWDIGAYSSGSSVSVQIAPPTSLTATIQ